MTSVLDGVMLSGAVSRAENDRIIETERTQAALTITDTVLNHPCHGRGCRHRNHRRDRLHAELLLEMLELPGHVTMRENYDELAW